MRCTFAPQHLSEFLLIMSFLELDIYERLRCLRICFPLTHREGRASTLESISIHQRDSRHPVSTKSREFA